MAEMKHTPGPWDCWDMDESGWHVFADKFGDRRRGQDCRLSLAMVRSGRSHVSNADNYYEGVANAKLMAAAPAMLAALIEARKITLETADVTGMHRPALICQIDAAISKAGG